MGKTLTWHNSLEFGGINQSNSRTEFKGDVFVGVGTTTIAAGFGNEANGHRGVNPFFSRKAKTIQSRLAFKPVEFDWF
jgi:hypothetical protein